VGGAIVKIIFKMCRQAKRCGFLLGVCQPPLRGRSWEDILAPRVSVFGYKNTCTTVVYAQESPGMAKIIRMGAVVTVVVRMIYE
jgi:hypothetical protein